MCLAFLEWFKSPKRNPRDLHEIIGKEYDRDDISVLELNHDGLFAWNGWGYGEKILRDSHAIGSGGQAALEGLRCGKPLEEAVARAFDHDEFTGCEVQVEYLLPQELKYVAITDNAKQMQVVVYRTAPDEEFEPDQKRVVCEVPVFDFPDGGAGANWNSLIRLHNSIIAQDTADYLWEWAEYDDAHLETPSKPGIVRIDINPNGTGCTKVWENRKVAAVMTLELATRTGLIYTQDRNHDDVNNVNAYYFVALDFRTGEVVWEKLMGTGDKYDNLGLPITIGPNKTL